MEFVVHILRYFRRTPGKDLFFKKNKARRVEAFTGDGWAGSVKDRRPTSAIGHLYGEIW